MSLIYFTAIDRLGYNLSPRTKCKQIWTTFGVCSHSPPSRNKSTLCLIHCQEKERTKTISHPAMQARAMQSPYEYVRSCVRRGKKVFPPLLRTCVLTMPVLTSSAHTRGKFKKKILAVFSFPSAKSQTNCLLL